MIRTIRKIVVVGVSIGSSQSIQVCKNRDRDIKVCITPTIIRRIDFRANNALLLSYDMMNGSISISVFLRFW